MKTTYLLFTKAMRAWLIASREQMNLRQVDVAKAVRLGKSFNTTQVLLSSLEQGAPKKIATQNWRKLQSYYLKNGAKPFVEATAEKVKEPMPQPSSTDATQLTKELKALKSASKSSWKSIAETLGLHAQTLGIFLRSGELGEKSLQKIRVGLDRLKNLDQALVAQGSLKPVKEVNRAKTPKVMAAKKAKPSIIHPAPVLPTRVALAMRELEAIKVLKEYDLTNRDFMNGSAMKLTTA